MKRYFVIFFTLEIACNSNFLACFYFRAHLNDLESIPVFLIVALLYSFSGLPAIRAIWCLRIFTAARILHTISYLNAITLPRAISFLVGAGCTVFLAGNVLYAAFKTGAF